MTHSSRTTRWLASLGVLFAFILIAIVVIWLLKLTGGERTAILLGLAVLGAAGAMLTWHVMRPTDAVSTAARPRA